MAIKIITCSKTQMKKYLTSLNINIPKNNKYQLSYIIELTNYKRTELIKMCKSYNIKTTNLTKNDMVNNIINKQNEPVEEIPIYESIEEIPIYITNNNITNYTIGPNEIINIYDNVIDCEEIPIYRPKRVFIRNNNIEIINIKEPQPINFKLIENYKMIELIEDIIIVESVEDEPIEKYIPLSFICEISKMNSDMQLLRDILMTPQGVTKIKDNHYDYNHNGCYKFVIKDYRKEQTPEEKKYEKRLCKYEDYVRTLCDENKLLNYEDYRRSLSDKKYIPPEENHNDRYEDYKKMFHLNFHMVPYDKLNYFLEKTNYSNEHKINEQLHNYLFKKYILLDKKNDMKYTQTYKDEMIKKINLLFCDLYLKIEHKMKMRKFFKLFHNFVFKVSHEMCDNFYLTEKVTNYILNNKCPFETKNELFNFKEMLYTKLYNFQDNMKYQKKFSKRNFYLRSFKVKKYENGKDTCNERLPELKIDYHFKHFNERIYLSDKKDYSIIYSDRKKNILKIYGHDIEKKKNNNKKYIHHCGGIIQKFNNYEFVD